MKNKVKLYIQEILTQHKKKNNLFRKTIYPKVVEIENTIFKNNSLVSLNSDTNIILKLPKISNILKIISNIETKNDSTSQIFYKSKDETFSEKNSIIWNTNQLNVEYIISDKLIDNLRLDAITTNGKFELKYFEIVSISYIEYYLSKKFNIAKEIKKEISKNPYLVNKFIKTVKNKGIKQSLIEVKNNINRKELDNNSGYKYIEPKLTNEIQEEIKLFKYKPLISIIIPVYNVDPKWLDLAIKSIENQWYKNWELCIVDDKSTNKKTLKYLTSLKNSKIKIKLLEKNLNISGSSNEALTLANGEYIALMDNDDELTPNALYEVVKAINLYNAEFIYSDEDKIEMDGTFTTPHFKPDFSPDMFLSQNYISHLGVIKRNLIQKVNGFTVGLEGAQDYDLYLKVLEHTDKITHISKVLYHWRKIPGSTATNFDDKSYAQEAGVRSLKNVMRRRNIDAEVLEGKYPGTYRVKYKIIDNPLVSIIIPFKDKPELLTMCIESILNKTTYTNFEIIGISNNSEEKDTFSEMERLSSLDKRIKFYEYNVPFNYSDINNYAVNTYAKGEQILLLNNDIEIITFDWIESMLEHSQRENIGVVGSKLYYPNDTIQHAGVVIGIGGIAGHSHKYLPKETPGYFSRLNLIQNLSAVTAACFMIKKTIFQEINGLNKKELKIAFNDVDFCLRVLEKGYINLFTPYCEAYHHESISRGHEDTAEKQKRFSGEVEFMQNRHSKILKDGDSYYNKNLTLDREDFSLQ